MTYGDFIHHIPLQVRFADIDRLNHVNNAVYHNFFELGRVRYFHKVLGEVINWDQFGFILARTEIDHIVPLFLNDEVHCFTRVAKIGNKSITIENVILKRNDEGMVESAKGIGILVAMNYTINESILVPEEWKNLIRNFEKVKP